MITQTIIDFFVLIVAWLVSLIPDLPPEVQEAIGQLYEASDDLGTDAAKLGVIVPWTTIGAMVPLWLGVMGFWGAALVVRLIIWAVGR